MFRLLLPYMLGAALLGGGVLFVNNWLNQKEEIARLERENATKELVIEQEREARRVADANAARERIKAEEYDRLKEALLRGGDDVQIPDWFKSWLADLLGGVQPDD